MRMFTWKTIEAIKNRANGHNLDFFGLFEIPFLASNDDLDTAKDMYKPLMPTGGDATDLTMVQGGAFAFKGTQELYKHRDTSVGVHADLQKVVAALAK
mmetsp:Transcript_14964/g.41088  ORF Transcript_14964/g.41088 Transcript_14964/m.41088 type:complete len:98 (-) Transcript_14964:131-424(-)